MTLYRHYPSKDDLIVAYLRESNKVFWEHFEATTRDASTAREKLLAFFAALQDYVMDACLLWMSVPERGERISRERIYGTSSRHRAQAIG